MLLAFFRKNEIISSYRLKDDFHTDLNSTFFTRGGGFLEMVCIEYMV